jgi:hypothetical protein
VHLSTDDRMVDVVEGGFDVVFRIGRLTDSGLVAAGWPPTGWWCAAPGVPGRAGTPREAADLLQLTCLHYALVPRSAEWRFRQGGRPSRCRRGPPLLHRRAQPARGLLAGAGLATVPSMLVAADVAAGRLQLVLEGARRAEFGVHALTRTGRRSLPGRALLDFWRPTSGRRDPAHPPPGSSVHRKLALSRPRGSRAAPRRTYHRWPFRDTIPRLGCAPPCRGFRGVPPALALPDPRAAPSLRGAFLLVILLHAGVLAVAARRVTARPSSTGAGEGGAEASHQEGGGGRAPGAVRLDPLARPRLTARRSGVGSCHRRRSSAASPRPRRRRSPTCRSSRGRRGGDDEGDVEGTSDMEGGGIGTGIGPGVGPGRGSVNPRPARPGCPTPTGSAGARVTTSSGESWCACASRATRWKPGQVSVTIPGPPTSIAVRSTVRGTRPTCRRSTRGSAVGRVRCGVLHRF